MVVSAILGGYRLGFIARATSWIGLVVGLLVAAAFLPDLVDSLNDYESSTRFLIAVGILVGSAFIGQALGLLLGANLHRALRLGALRPVDKAAGGDSRPGRCARRDLAPYAVDGERARVAGSPGRARRKLPAP